MKRFLRYSLEKGRKIRAVLLEEGQMAQRTMQVLEETDGGIIALIGKKLKTISYDEILSCDYARGDHGED